MQREGDAERACRPSVAQPRSQPQISAQSRDDPRRALLQRPGLQWPSCAPAPLRSGRPLSFPGSNQGSLPSPARSGLVTWVLRMRRSAEERFSPSSCSMLCSIAAGERVQ